MDIERYLRIHVVRGHAVNSGPLRIYETAGDDLVLQAMMRINETQELEWLNQQIVSDIAPE